MVMFQLYQIVNGVGTPLNDTQVLSGVFKANTLVTINVTGTDLTVQAQNSTNSQTLSMEGTVTPNDFGGAGVAWYGTVSPGNSNVYSQIEISYPGAANPCPPTPVQIPKPGSGCGCAASGGLSGSDVLVSILLISIVMLAARKRLLTSGGGGARGRAACRGRARARLPR
jgi:hypothetical protein